MKMMGILTPREIIKYVEKVISLTLVNEGTRDVRMVQRAVLELEAEFYSPEFAQYKDNYARVAGLMPEYTGKSYENHVKQLVEVHNKMGLLGHLARTREIHGPEFDMALCSLGVNLQMLEASAETMDYNFQEAGSSRTR